MFESPPVVYFDYGSPEKLYTVVFVDLDGGPAEDKVFLHWIVANVAVSWIEKGLSEQMGMVFVKIVFNRILYIKYRLSARS